MYNIRVVSLRFVLKLVMMIILYTYFMINLRIVTKCETVEVVICELLAD